MNETNPQQAVGAPLERQVRPYQHHRVTGLTREQAEAMAAKFTAPAWATHVAVRWDGSRCEPACWQDREQEYLDEDPSLLKIGDWAGSFKQSYWSFVPVSYVSA